MDKDIEPIVTAICSLGCDRVHEVIQALISGQRTPELGSADAAQCAVVLRELEGIMAVYNDKQRNRPC